MLMSFPLPDPHLSLVMPSLTMGQFPASAPATGPSLQARPRQWIVVQVLLESSLAIQ